MLHENKRLSNFFLYIFPAIEKSNHSKVLYFYDSKVIMLYYHQFAHLMFVSLCVEDPQSSFFVCPLTSSACLLPPARVSIETCQMTNIKRITVSLHNLNALYVNHDIWGACLWTSTQGVCGFDTPRGVFIHVNNLIQLYYDCAILLHTVTCLCFCALFKNREILKHLFEVYTCKWEGGGVKGYVFIRHPKVFMSVSSKVTIEIITSCLSEPH